MNESITWNENIIPSTLLKFKDTNDTIYHLRLSASKENLNLILYDIKRQVLVRNNINFSFNIINSQYAYLIINNKHKKESTGIKFLGINKKRNKETKIKIVPLNQIKDIIGNKKKEENININYYEMILNKLNKIKNIECPDKESKEIKNECAIFFENINTKFGINEEEIELEINSQLHKFPVRSELYLYIYGEFTLPCSNVAKWDFEKNEHICMNFTPNNNTFNNKLKLRLLDDGVVLLENSTNNQEKYHWNKNNWTKIEKTEKIEKINTTKFLQKIHSTPLPSLKIPAKQEDLFTVKDSAVSPDGAIFYGGSSRPFAASEFDSTDYSKDTFSFYLITSDNKNVTHNSYLNYLAANRKDNINGNVHSLEIKNTWNFSNFTSLDKETINVFDENKLPIKFIENFIESNPKFEESKPKLEEDNKIPHFITDSTIGNSISVDTLLSKSILSPKILLEKEGKNSIKEYGETGIKININSYINCGDFIKALHSYRRCNKNRDIILNGKNYLFPNLKMELDIIDNLDLINLETGKSYISIIPLQVFQEMKLDDRVNKKVGDIIIKLNITKDRNDKIHITSNVELPKTIPSQTLQ